jgi:hypothetical protein
MCKTEQIFLEKIKEKDFFYREHIPCVYACMRVCNAFPRCISDTDTDTEGGGVVWVDA